MRARIELTPEMVADVLREYVEARGCTYVDHEIMPDNGIHIVAEFEFKKSVVTPTATSGAQGVRQQAPDNAGGSSVYARKLREDEKKPDDPHDDGDMDKPYQPVKREHPKAVDEEFAAEFARILEENNRILEEEKAKRN